MAIELGKPADYGQFILTRRYNLAKAYAGAALRRGGMYIDVGCGNGAQTVLFAKHFNPWLGLDVEEERLQEFRHELSRENYGLGFDNRIERYDGNRIPAHDNSADFLTCIEVVEHTESDTATIAELYRVLKPGATAVITVPNKWWVFETHGANLPVLPWNRVPFFSWLPKKLHSKFAKARIYRKSEIEGMLKNAGFKIGKSVYVTAPMDMIKNPALQRAVRSAVFGKDETKLPILATSVMLIVTK
jgi:ubiquinone/menaquinone biosynthesis C-methylase UbiE